MRRHGFLIAGLIAVCLSGCLPRTFVKKDPGPHDRGIRYYRPKPYLKVTPLETLVKDGDDVKNMLQPGFVRIEQVMLPDFSEEYSIHIRSGLGVNNTNVVLTDGWNLTSLNAQLDSKFDENVKAIAELVKAPLGGGGKEGGVPRSFSGELTSLTVPAYNVPLGLYEAVLSPDALGHKRLYGFRYVGFFPYGSCPVDVCGVQQEHCQSAILYGMVYDQSLNAMVFKELSALASTPMQPVDNRRIESANNSNPAEAAEDPASTSKPGEGEIENPPAAGAVKAASRKRLSQEPPEVVPTPKPLESR